MDINSLLAINKKAIFDKLDKVEKKDNTYKVIDLIAALSTSIDRDRGIVNNYLPDEVFIRRVKCNGILRAARFFTLKGIARYLHEGKIYSYKNACEYFKVEPKDLEEEKLLNELKDMKVNSLDGSVLYDTKRLLRWLFEKRKSAKHLGDECSATTMLEYIDSLDEDELMIVNSRKLKILKK